MLTKTANLVEVNLKVFVSSQLLATLRQCRPLLSSLEIWVDEESHEAMAQVGLFEHVKHLGIARQFVRSEGPHLSEAIDRWTVAPSWNMPAVTHFSWHDRLLKPLHVATFVSRCRFPHLQHLDISLENPHPIPEGMSCIYRFLDAHRNIRSLRIMALDEEHMSIVPFMRARNLQIRCIPLCPPQAWVSLLRPEVKTLELELSRYNSKRSLWELLTHFAAEDDTRPTLEKIHLRSGESPYDDHDDHDMTTVHGFSSTLRSHILPLKARGIRVFVDDREIRI
jgi:hypothetical protein